MLNNKKKYIRMPEAISIIETMLDNCEHCSALRVALRDIKREEIRSYQECLTILEERVKWEEAQLEKDKISITQRKS